MSNTVESQISLFKKSTTMSDLPTIATTPTSKKFTRIAKIPGGCDPIALEDHTSPMSVTQFMNTYKNILDGKSISFSPGPETLTINGKMIPKDQIESCVINPGDQISIVGAVASA
jgi:sulfur carrier protein ThiS